MEKINQILEKINTKTIKLEDILDLDLTEQEFSFVMEALKKSGIEVIEKSDEIKIENENAYISNDSVKQYLEEIGKIPILNKEEEKELFLEYSKTKNPKIREKLINSNLKLVVSVAKHFCHKTKYSTIDFLDLIQDGNEGLMKAIEKYDATYGYKFSTYATWWIKQGIRRASSYVAKPIRMPVHLEELLNKISSYIVQKKSETGHTPTVKNIAQHFGVSEESVKLSLELSSKKFVSLEEKVSEESNSTVCEFVEDQSIDIETDYMIKEIYNDLRQTIKEILTTREYCVISYRFGIVNDVNDCSIPMTLEQVGAKLGVTRERIRQIEAKALRKLRFREKANKIKSLIK